MDKGTNMSPGRNFKIAFFTEGGYFGKVPLFDNLSVVLSWQYHLNSDHYCVHKMPEKLNTEYDLGIIIIPKERFHSINQVIPIAKQQCEKIAFMQEGDVRGWTDKSLEDQLTYLGMLQEADIMFCHNESDKKYFEGILDVPVYIMYSVMVEESLPKERTKYKKAPIIGGNMCKWYNGMSSFLIAKEYQDAKGEQGLVYAPSMGRKVQSEELLEGISHLPWLSFSKWMQALSSFEIGVHMMPTVAAGTFSLNCAYWGIPCIGNTKIDTQRICHPHLSVEIDDMKWAIESAKSLATDKEFYNRCSKMARMAYEERFHEDAWLARMKYIIGKEFGLFTNNDVVDVSGINFI